jgi:hypothetical protein
LEIKHLRQRKARLILYIGYSNDVPLKDKMLIADDSIAPKTGEKMEMVSYHLVYILNKRRITGSIGSIFNDVIDKQEPLLFAEKIWSYVRDQLLK